MKVACNGAPIKFHCIACGGTDIEEYQGYTCHNKPPFYRCKDCNMYIRFNRTIHGCLTVEYITESDFSAQCQCNDEEPDELWIDQSVELTGRLRSDVYRQWADEDARDMC